MASLDAEEALLKKKLENTDNLEDRRELRRQLRELRNRKFEEEIKKVTASDYRPGRTKTALSNGVDSSLSSVGRKESVETKDDGEDVYGINHLETEEELQALLNETPFTETEKRKKIRARIREIRNHKLGLGDAVVVRRATSEEKPKEASSIVEKANDSGKRNYSSTVHSSRDVKEDKESERNERSTYSSRGSYRSRQRNEEDTYISRSSSKRGGDIDTESAGRFTSTTKLRSSASDNEKSSSIKENNVGIEDDKEVENQNSSHLDTGILEREEKEDAKGVGKEDQVEMQNEQVENEDKENEETENEGGEEVEVDEDDVEDVVEEEGTSYEGKAMNGYGEDRINSLKDDREDDLGDREDDREDDEDEEDIDSQSRSSASKNYDELDKKEEIDAQDDVVDEDFVDNDEAAADEEDLEEEGYDEDGAEIGDDFVEDINEFSDNDEEDKRGNEDRQQSDIDKRDKDYSAEDADSYVEDELDDREPERMEPDPSEQSLNDEEYSDEENQSINDDDYSSDGEEEGKIESEEEPTTKEGRTMHEYSDDYSEGFSDHTATDEGSSISGKKYDDDQDLAGYEFEKHAVERKKAGASYISKVDEVFKQKEPALAEGKSFKELLKKSDKGPAEKPLGSKRGPEQVDFRTVLRSSDKAKKAGEKSSSTVEQVDFRNLLQKKVKTRTLADKEIGAEQVDFRTVLRQASISSEKKEAPARKSSNAEQLDFRNVLKKQPSIKSRKLSMEDKNELIKSIRAGRDTTNAEEKSPAEQAPTEKAPTEKPGRPSLESLRQGGGVDKAKDELNKNLKEDAEGTKTQRKAGRPSLDALKKSGELGKTEDKKGVFEKTSRAKKAPTTVPPKSSAKGKVNATSEKDELEVIEEPELIEEVEEEPSVGNDDRNAVKSSVRKSQKNVVEVSSKETVPRKASIEASSKKNVEKKSQNTGVKISSTANVEKSHSRRKNEESTKIDAGKEDMQSRRVSQEAEERRSPTKSGDKRARNRRLRQDQNEAVQAQGEDVRSEKKEVKKIAETKQKSSSIERLVNVFRCIAAVSMIPEPCFGHSFNPWDRYHGPHGATKNVPANREGSSNTQ